MTRSPLESGDVGPRDTQESLTILTLVVEVEQVLKARSEILCVLLEFPRLAFPILLPHLLHPRLPWLGS